MKTTGRVILLNLPRARFQPPKVRILQPRSLAGGILAAAVLPAILAACLAGQTAPPARGKIDPEVFVIFLRVHANLHEDAQKNSTQNPAAANAVEREMARSIGVGPPTLRSLVSNYQALLPQLAAIDQENYRYVQRQVAQRVAVDPAVLIALEARRQNAIFAAINKLKAALPAPEWDAVEIYLAGPFQRYIKRSPLR